MEALRLVLRYVHLIGFAMLLGGGDHEPSPVKLAVKLLIAVLIFVMVFFARKRTDVNRGHFLAIIGMTLLNAGVATFWH